MLELLEFLMQHQEELTMFAAVSTILGNAAAFLNWLWKKLHEYFFF